MLRPLLLVGVLVKTAAAQTTAASDSSVIIGTRYVMTSRVLGEPRPYWIHVPAAVPAERMPLIVLLDGDAHFHHATGVTTFLASQGRMPNAIVVAVPNTTDRTRDLTPATRDTLRDWHTAGGDDRFLSFLSDELLPEIDRRYHTNGFRILIGHSLGGLFAMDVWLMQPGIFQAYIAISPSMWWDRQRMIDTLEARLASDAVPQGWMYATMGGLEGEGMLGPFRRIAQLLRQRASGRDWRLVELARDDHGSTPNRSIYEGLETIYRQWYVPPDSLAILGMAGLDRRYRDTGPRYGMGAETPEVAFNALGYVLLRDSAAGVRRSALDAFRANARRFPRSANTWDSLGDAYRALGNRTAALACFAASLRTARRHPEEGTVFPGSVIAPSSQEKLRQVAVELGRPVWGAAAIPETVAADCLRG